MVSAFLAQTFWVEMILQTTTCREELCSIDLANTFPGFAKVLLWPFFTQNTNGIRGKH
jgi:hypothetical protein